MRSKELRELFYKFFKDLDHKKVLSSPLIPAKDQTLLFTNAGMNQFKDIFIGREKREYNRAVSIQKCLRVSGKHNDFDEVGKTDHHHTFFEMLGNFSFGDYFKEKAIKYAWDFLTLILKLPEDKLWISVYKDDQEAYDIWKKNIGIPEKKISKRGGKDNFWQMGDIGPCGPCSEIHYDRGTQYGSEEDFDKSPNRFVEIWNLVFIQYNQQEDGELIPLDKPSIDTGMGMERLAAIKQNVKSNYDTDLFLPLKKFIAKSCNKKFPSPKFDIDLNIIADHARAITFLISDSISPSNEGRGYVLRRIIRRASKHGRTLGFNKPFLSKICLEVIKLMGEYYPELESSSEHIRQIVKIEEERFIQTLSNGLAKFEELVIQTRLKKQVKISGQELFKLSDTYGFPLDFAADLAKEYDLEIDFKGFNRALEKQRILSKSTQKFQKSLKEFENSTLQKTLFCGYIENTSGSKILVLYSNAHKQQSHLTKTQEGILIVDKTPFYAESGGQVADIGKGKGDGFFVEIHNVLKINDLYLHYFKVINGKINEGDSIQLTIDEEHRLDIAVHHTLTHILHWALREILGPHVKQSGSYLDPLKLRFDFTHHQALSEEELSKIERLVNLKIQKNEPVSVKELQYEDALQKGALAFFDEKYFDQVRTISIGNWSMELCGGTHLQMSGQAGFFKITEESSISAGVRRIEAKGGKAALQLIQKEDKIFKKVLNHFRQKPDLIFQYLLDLQRENKQLNKNLQKVKTKDITHSIDSLIQNSTKINNINVTIAMIKGVDKKQLGNLADSIKVKTRGIVIMFSNIKDKSFITVSVDKTLIPKFNATKIIKAIANLVQGKGGGKEEFAQAGGTVIKDGKRLNTEILKILRLNIEKI